MISQSLNYLYEQWARMCLSIAIFMILPFIFFYNEIGEVNVLIWIQIPLYLIHQFEEHYNNGFKHFVNQTVFKIHGADYPLNDKIIFWINIPVIWILFPIFAIFSVYNPEWGILLPVFAITNALIHVGGFFILKFTYNPGLIASVVLNIPIGLYTILVLNNSNNLSNIYFGIAILFAIITHILIAVPMRLRAKSYQTTLLT